MSADPPDDPDGEGDPDALRVHIERLEAENRRLREAYGHVRRTRHRRTAIGLAAIGGVAVAGALVFVDARPVLLALGATGLFGGLLTWFLTPERFVAADVGERGYAALARNHAALVDALDLGDRRLYVPLAADPGREAALYVPQTAAGADAVDPAALGELFVRPDDPDGRGVSLEPTGGPLLGELRAATPGGLADAPAALVEQLADGLRAQFELVDGVEPDVDPADGRASLAIRGSAFGAVDRFDHPVASLIATGLAVGLDTPVELTVDPTPDGRGEYLVTARWEPAAEAGD